MVRMTQYGKPDSKTLSKAEVESIRCAASGFKSCVTLITEQKSIAGFKTQQEEQQVQQQEQQRMTNAGNPLNDISQQQYMAMDTDNNHGRETKPYFAMEGQHHLEDGPSCTTTEYSTITTSDWSASEIEDARRTNNSINATQQQQEQNKAGTTTRKSAQQQLET